mmetsp:Transcript_73660/g.119562  ORF Transcript_73660/g.119562 Transcript_73660/m.119562 type:complete len:110 (-) Transcript_73660:812-1141(-)
MQRYNTLCHQESPDVPNDKVPLEPTGRGMSRTRRDASAEMLPLEAPAPTPPVCTALDQMSGASPASLSLLFSITSKPLSSRSGHGGPQPTGWGCGRRLLMMKVGAQTQW